jgi:hypothetical protein
MTFVTALQARTGRERLRRDRAARGAGGSPLGGSRAAHDVATHTSDQDRQDSVTARDIPARRAAAFAELLRETPRSLSFAPVSNALFANPRPVVSLYGRQRRQRTYVLRQIGSAWVAARRRNSSTW